MLAAYGIFVLVGVSAGIGGVLLPAQISDYDVDKTTIGITFFTFSAGFMVAGATVGALVHRLRIGGAIAVGGATFTVAALYTGIRPPFVGLLVAQLVAGYGIGLLESALNAYLSELRNATALLNRLHAFFGVGALVGPAIAAWVLESMRWTAVWLILGVASIVLIGLFLLANKSAGTDDVREARMPEPARSSPSGHGLFGAAIRCRGVQYGSLFLAVYVGLEIGVGTWAFTYLVGHFHQTAVLAGYTVSGYWLGLTAGRFLISPTSARLGVTPAATSFGCLTGVAASSVLVWASPATALAAAGFVLLGFFLAPLFPTAMAMAPRLATPRLAAAAIGVMNGASVLGGSFFSWLSGAIAQGAGVWTLMPIALGLALLMLLLWSRVIAQVTTAASTETHAGTATPARG